jgi:hypothetical protein
MIAVNRGESGQKIASNHVGHLQVDERFPEQESLWHKNYDAHKQNSIKMAKSWKAASPANDAHEPSVDSERDGIQDGSAFRDEINTVANQIVDVNADEDMRNGKVCLRSKIYIVCPNVR